MDVTCQHCGKDLYQALREGCSHAPCVSVSRDFSEPRVTYYEFPKDDEKTPVTLSERFNPIFTGFQWYVVDREGSWYPMNDKDHAEDRARAWSYEWDAICGGR